MLGWFRKRKIKRILASPWPEAWNAFLFQNVRLSHFLTQAELSRLKDRTKVFVSEKHWEGIDGFEVTDEVKVTIAAQACMMLLGVTDFYFDNVRTLLIFPESFQRKMHDGTSVGNRHLSGEAWQDGPISLSWLDVIQGCRYPGNGSNVVIHEFAHALDGLDGYMGGNISFDHPESEKTWNRILKRDYQQLLDASNSGKRTFLDPYGATNEAEFFAVITEAFFEMPQMLQMHYAEIYDLLVEYFKINPADWQ